MNRKEFIRTSVLAGSGLVLMVKSFALQRHNSTSEIADVDGELNDLLTINPNGEVRYQCIKHEMGQGVSTAMAMIIAEELCADWQNVTIELPDTDMKRFQNDKNGGHDTGGSCTIIYQYDLLRKAGATARQMLINAAAQHWNVS